MLTDVAGQVTPLTTRLDMLADWITAIGVGGELHLYQAPTSVIGPEVVLGDLVEADYDGYAALDPVAWSAPAIAPDQTAFTLSTSTVFACTGSTTPNMIYGAYATTAAGAALIAVFPFTTPIPMANNGDVLPLVVQFHTPGE